MILIACSTFDGHTRTICERVQAVLQSLGQPATVVAMEDVAALNLDAFAKIVVGASIRYGHHRRNVLDFAARHVALLNTRPSAFFSVNVVARKATKNRAETNPYVRHFLARVAWRPALVDVFAGRLDYPRLRWLDRQLIRFIMRVTGGPTDPQGTFEFTDWQRVEDFARRLAAL